MPEDAEPPTIDDGHRRAIIDAEHLRLLGLGYYLSAAMTAFFALFGLLYMVMGVAVGVFGRQAPHAADAPPEAFGLFIAIFGGVFFLVTAALSGLKVFVARCLERRRHRILCLVVAGVSCLEMPYGTAIGVCTFVVLARPEVRRQFDIQ